MQPGKPKKFDVTLQGRATMVRATWVRVTGRATRARATCSGDFDSKPYAEPIHDSPSPPVLLPAAASQLLLFQSWV